jgi:hypothetical protein
LNNASRRSSSKQKMWCLLKILIKCGCQSINSSKKPLKYFCTLVRKSTNLNSSSKTKSSAEKKAKPSELYRINKTIFNSSFKGKMTIAIAVSIKLTKIKSYRLTNYKELKNFRRVVYLHFCSIWNQIRAAKMNILEVVFVKMNRERTQLNLYDLLKLRDYSIQIKFIISLETSFRSHRLDEDYLKEIYYKKTSLSSKRYQGH